MLRKNFLAKVNWSNARYERMVFEVYYRWCETYSWNDNTHQKLLANRQMYNWWYKQFQLLEEFVLTINDKNPNLPKQQLMIIYDKQIAKIKDYYPKAKIQEALKGSKKVFKARYRTELQNLN